MQVRFATGGAAAGWAEVQQSASPYLVGSEESVLHDMATHRGTLARYVVVEDGEVLGIARVRTGGPGQVTAMVQVHADHRGRGVARLLHERVVAVAGGREVSGLVNGDDHSLAVARHWGFETEHEHRVSTVVPGDAALPPATPPGLRVAPLSDLTAEQVWRCHRAAAPGDPSGLSRATPLEEYVDTRWNAPLHRPDLGTAALDGDTVLAFCEIDAASGRAWNSMTGTLPGHRGRGLATLVKAHALAAMAAAGITRCSTANDGRNRAMLAVNERLGYRPAAAVWSARMPCDSLAVPRALSAERPQTNRV